MFFNEPPYKTRHALKAQNTTSRPLRPRTLLFKDNCLYGISIPAQSQKCPYFIYFAHINALVLISPIALPILQILF